MQSKGLAQIVVVLIILAAVMAVFVATVLLTSNQGNDNNADLNGVTPTPTITPDLNQIEQEKEGNLSKVTETITVNGVPCLTGPGAVERVLLKWGFKSVKWNTCDNADGNAFFCDPTQFSLSLAGRLERMQELAENGKTEEARALKEFDSLLIPDNYSIDFQKDFAYYYKGEFFETPTWFTKWARYFSDENRLVFNPRDISNEKPGLYHIKIDFNFPGKEFEFFSKSAPTSSVMVEFKRKRDFNGIDSFFYYLPFDGMVGTKRQDENKEAKREDYGVGYRPGSQRIVLQENEQGIVDSSARGGLKQLVVAKPAEFQYTNTRSGLIAFISKEDGIITFSPQNATVVIASLKSNAGGENLFYRFFENGKEIGENREHMAYWQAVSKSEYPEGQFLEYFSTPKPDERAQSTEACEEALLEGGNVFGVHTSSLQPNKRALLKSYFFTPLDSSVVLENACSNSPEFLATEREAISGLHKGIELGNSSNKIAKFYELAELTRRGQVCASEENKKSLFYWNASALKKQEENALKRAGLKGQAK